MAGLWALMALVTEWWIALLRRGNLKCVGIYLFFLIINLLVNLLGIPVGTLCGLDSDGIAF